MSLSARRLAGPSAFLTLVLAALMLAGCRGESAVQAPAVAAAEGEAKSAVIGESLKRALADASPTDSLGVIVTFHGKGAPTLAQLDALRALGLSGTHLRSFPIVGVTAFPAQVAQIAALPGVRSVYANDRLTYDNDMGTNVTSVRKLRADAAMTAANGGLPFTGKGVTVMVNDSGLDGTHPDFADEGHVVQNVHAGPRAACGDAPEACDILPLTWVEDVPNSDATTSHGTHVAGIVGATGAASGGKYQGVAPGASLVGYGSGAALFVLDALGGFDYAKQNRDRYDIRVITNSFGNNSQIGDDFEPNDPTNVVTQELAEDLGMVVVFSAGNSGDGEGTITGVFKKAPWVLVAANGTRAGLLASTSSRGQFGATKQWTDTERGITYTVTDRPTVIAPGSNVVSTRAASVDPLPFADATDGIAAQHLPYYTIKSGTSMAAPHLAGIVALMLEANPDLTWREVKDILQRTATNVADLADWEGGAGYANAYAAVAMAKGLGQGYGVSNKLYRAFASKANQRVGKVEKVSLQYVPVNVEDVEQLHNYKTFEVNAATSLVVAFGVIPSTEVYPGTMRIALQDPNGVLYNPSQGIPGAFLSGYRVATAPGVPGTWKILLRGTCGLNVNGAPAQASACPDMETFSGVSTPPTEPVEVTIKQIETNGFVNLADVVGHPARGFIEYAIASQLIDGRVNAGFQPNAALTRFELADLLTLGPGLRQSLPLNGATKFTDLTAAQAPFAEAATALGGALRDDNLVEAEPCDPTDPSPECALETANSLNGVTTTTRRDARAAIELAPGAFNPTALVPRSQLAYSLVQAIGLEEAAAAFTGDITYLYNDVRIPVGDAGSVPAGLKGYVQAALDLGLITPSVSIVSTPTGPQLQARFRPAQAVTRAEYAIAAVRAKDAYRPRCISGDTRPEC